MTLVGVPSATTVRVVLAGLWIDAALVMVASAWNGGRAIQNLGDPFLWGVLLGVAVDIGLAMALIGDRALHRYGRVEPWGRTVRIITALMSLGLNCAVSIKNGQVGLTVFHSFLPILLILLSEYQQSCSMQFHAIAANQEAREQAARDAQLTADWERHEAQLREQQEIEQRQANGELVTAQDTLAEAQRMRTMAQTEAAEAIRLRELAVQERDATEVAVTATRAAAEKLARQQPKPSGAKPGGKRKDAGPEVRRQWIREQRAAGHNPTGAEVDKQFGPPKSGWRLVKQIEEEIDAELADVVRTAR